MKIIRAKDYDDMSRKAANIVAAQIYMKPGCVLGLATGSTPVGTYRRLCELNKGGELDFSEVRTVNLDEYAGLAETDPQSYRVFMNENLFDHINIRMENTNVPNGLAADMDAECVRYDEIISALGGIDLQVLGIGENGHIGFNEPDSSFVKGTHVVELTRSTIEANSRNFASVGEVPRRAVTMGMGAILSARKIIILVSGEKKADALRDMLSGPITPSLPASILQLHGDATIIADEAALSKI